MPENCCRNLASVIEVEQAFGEALFEGGEGFGGAGHGADNGPKPAKRYP